MGSGEHSGQLRTVPGATVPRQVVRIFRGGEYLGAGCAPRKQHGAGGRVPLGQPGEAEPGYPGEDPAGGC